MKALELKSTFALGGMCLVLVLMLMGSGALMLFSYQPVPKFAYTSVQFLDNQFVFGRLIRSVHYFSANLLVMTVFCHMLRVFFTGGYYGTRKLNWIIGVCVLNLVLLACFTGYLLPWDQTAFWAVTICINMFDYIPGGVFLKELVISGNDVGEKTLQLFFTFHTTLIPGSLILFLATHFWKVRKAKGVVTSGLSALEENETPVMVKTSPNLLLREAVAGLLLIAVVMTLSVAFDAPLDDMANTGLSPNPAKAPWYFSGFQELLLHFHPLFAVFIIPGMIFCVLTFLPFVQGKTQNPGIWFMSEPAKKAAGTAVILSGILTPGLILLDEYLIDFQKWLPKIPPVLSTGAVPFVMSLSMVLLLHFWIKKKQRLTHAEAFQTSVIFLITAFVILTLTCVWFRGAGMQLVLGGP